MYSETLAVGSRNERGGNRQVSTQQIAMMLMAAGAGFFLITGNGFCIPCWGRGHLDIKLVTGQVIYGGPCPFCGGDGSIFS